MEAATPLPFSQVRVVGDTLRVDGLVVRDDTAVRLAAEADHPDRLVADAIEIGARVLDREQVGANADFVKAEFEKAARDLDDRFVERAKRVADRLDEKVDEVFGPESGHVTKALERHFGDGSSVAVQHQVKAVVGEVMVRSREDLLRQFSSADGSNPLAGFQKGVLASLETASRAQHAHLREMNETIVGLRGELAALKAEKEKLAEVSAVAELGTAKGRTYEEAVFEAVDAVAIGRGDDCDAVGDTRGEGGKKGDVLVAIDACAGAPRGRIVFEAKDRKLSKNVALAELDEAIETRCADFGVLVVPTEDELPAKTHPLREFNGNKLFVVFDPRDGSRLALEVAYALARARVLMARDEAEGLDVTALRAEVERATQAMADVQKIKTQLANATTGIETARKYLDVMAGNVRGHLGALDELLAGADDGDLVAA